MEQYLIQFSDQQLNAWRKLTIDELIQIKPFLVNVGYPDKFTDAKFCHEVNQALWRVDKRYDQQMKNLATILRR